jgi:hypothetical protein
LLLQTYFNAQADLESRGRGVTSVQASLTVVETCHSIKKYNIFYDEQPEDQFVLNLEQRTACGHNAVTIGFSVLIACKNNHPQANKLFYSNMKRVQ